jgi:hypothetical protein
VAIPRATVTITATAATRAAAAATITAAAAITAAATVEVGRNLSALVHDKSVDRILPVTPTRYQLGASHVELVLGPLHVSCIASYNRNDISDSALPVLVRVQI